MERRKAEKREIEGSTIKGTGFLLGWQRLEILKWTCRQTARLHGEYELRIQERKMDR